MPSPWFKKPKNIAVTVIAILMAITAIVFVIWGVTHHEEGGLLEVCWHNGVAHYEKGSVEDTRKTKTNHERSCERTEKLVWPQEQIPITIASLSTARQSMAADSPQVRVLKQAVSDFNRQLRFELLRVGTQLDATDAEARFGGAFEKTGGRKVLPPGYVTHVRVGGALRGYIFVRLDVSSIDRLLYLVLQHELGHLVGLSHDDFHMSVMFPIQQDDSMRDRMSMAYLTDFDIALLRELYYRPILSTSMGLTNAPYDLALLPCSSPRRLLGSRPRRRLPSRGLWL